MLAIIKSIITNVLSALYQVFGFSVLLAVLFMFFYLYVSEHGGGLAGIKTVLAKWGTSFKSSSVFRRSFLLSFYTAMILFRTLLNRNLWMNPLSDVMTGWTLTNAKGELTTESIENLMLFIPFSILLLWAVKDKLLKDKKGLGTILWQSTRIVFCFSLSIEFLQLFFRLGTFQLSDIFYNTLGGFLGGLIYGIGYKVQKKS